MFRDLLAYFLYQFPEISENLLAGSPERQWRYLTICSCTTTKIQSGNILAPFAMPRNQPMVYLEFSCDEQASLISLFLSPFSWQLASSGRFFTKSCSWILSGIYHHQKTQHLSEILVVFCCFGIRIDFGHIPTSWNFMEKMDATLSLMTSWELGSVGKLP